ncbi:FCD domain protein [Mycobacterium ulcerans str. Harvey]|uniref:FCD domain protein n=1 Tax=Mycobacterium ulcerans str. Harvey TaxID=1299332 RepID=A0ABP3AF22_MYCUL|nr:FCD domain protein [Mycobacterium ulcerans str. Harvey]
MLDARLVFEPLAASLAAEHIDEAGIDRLRAVLRAEEQRKPGCRLRVTSSMWRWRGSRKIQSCNSLSKS